MRLQTIAALVALALTVGCASGGARTMAAAAAAAAPPPAAAQDTSGIGPQYPSTYKRHPNPPVLIRNATIMTAAGQEIQGGSILFKDGRIRSEERRVGKECRYRGAAGYDKKKHTYSEH